MNPRLHLFMGARYFLISRNQDNWLAIDYLSRIAEWCLSKAKESAHLKCEAAATRPLPAAERVSTLRCKNGREPAHLRQRREECGTRKV